MQNVKAILIPLLPLIIGLNACGGSSTRPTGAEAPAGDNGGEPGDTRPAPPFELDVPVPVTVSAGGSGTMANGDSQNGDSQNGGTQNGGTVNGPSDVPASAAGEPGEPSPGSPAPRPPHEVVQTLEAVQALSGVLADPARPGRLTAFLSFDLRELPAGIVRLQQATVHTGEYVVQAPVPIYDVSFPTLSSATEAKSGALITTLPVGLSGDQLVPPALWPALVSDYVTRDVRPYAQFRLDLPAGTSEGLVNALVAKTSIEVDYFVP